MKARRRTTTTARLVISMMVSAAIFVLGVGTVLGAVSQADISVESDLPELVDPHGGVGVGTGVNYIRSTEPEIDGAVDNPATIRNADRSDVISELRSAAVVDNLDQYSMRDMELNENPPMYRSARTAGSINRMGEGINEFRSIEENTVLPAASSSRLGEGVNNYQFIEENTVLPAAASSSRLGEGVNNYRFIEENTVLPGPSGSDEWKGTLHEYQFMEQNTVLPGPSASDDWQGTRFEHQFIEEQRARSKVGPSGPSKKSDLPGFYEHDY